MPLNWSGQDDFSAGAVRSVARHLIPPNGVYSIENGLLDDDGSVYRRGGSEYRSATAFGGGGLRWLWDGYLAGGQRTVFANASDFGVLALDGATAINLGGTGLASPVRAVVVGGMLFIPGGTIYAGSLKAADYSAGTASVTEGSKTVNGTSTAWLANVDPGMLFRLSSGRYYTVASVISDSQLLLDDAYAGATAATQGYALTRLGSAASPYRVASIYATVAERLVSVVGSRVSFSAGRSELGVLQPYSFAATDFHELPEGSVGLGAATIRDLLLVFATDGIWAINNMTYDLTDAAGNFQQQMQPTQQEIVLWGAAGISSYRGALVVPAVDGVYLIDGTSPPVPVSDSIIPLLVDHVRDGHKPGGGVVFKSHYFLPVLDETEQPVDLLVCRLDRAVRVRSQTFFPWSWFRGHGGEVAALARRVSSGSARQPELLGAGADNRVLRLTGAFSPSSSALAPEVEGAGSEWGLFDWGQADWGVAPSGGTHPGQPSDANGTAHRWLLETRDFPTGHGNVNTVRRLRIRYEMFDAASDDPIIRGYYSIGERPTFAGSEWGLFDWGVGVWTDASLRESVLLSGVAPENSGRDRHTWHLRPATRFLRARLESAGPAAKLVLRSVEIATRPSAKDR